MEQGSSTRHASANTVHNLDHLSHEALRKEFIALQTSHQKLLKDNSRLQSDISKLSQYIEELQSCIKKIEESLPWRAGYYGIALIKRLLRRNMAKNYFMQIHKTLALYHHWKKARD